MNIEADKGKTKDELENEQSTTNANEKVQVENEDNKKGMEDDSNEDIEVDDEFNDEEEGGEIMGSMVKGQKKKSHDDDNDNKNNLMVDDGMNNIFGIPEFTRRDKTLEEILDMMVDNPPIIPDAVIEYYMRKNGFEDVDIRVKRLLGLVTQKFVSDIANDAYEYSRIRSGVAVNNANNGQARARQLMFSQQQQPLTQQQQQQNEKTTQSKVVLTINDLSSAVEEYGLNIGRPDFYR